MTSLVNCIYSNNNKTYDKNKVRGDRNRSLNGGRKICNITGAYVMNRNEEIKKITN